MGSVKLVAIDLDGTIWDCEDISMLTPPFKRLEENVIVDAEGIKVRVREGVREFLKLCASKGVILATLSWNDPKKALEALKSLGLINYFHYHAIEYHPRKHEMLLNLINKLRSEGINVSPEEIVYIDDRDIHVGDVVKYVGNVKFIQLGKDFSDFNELRLMLEEMLGR